MKTTKQRKTVQEKLIKVSCLLPESLVDKLDKDAWRDGRGKRGPTVRRIVAHHYHRTA